MIKLIRDNMLYDRYIQFEDERGHALFLIDTDKAEDRDAGGLYLWTIEGSLSDSFDTLNRRLKVVGVDEV